jgi:hypothetical protein
MSEPIRSVKRTLATRDEIVAAIDEHWDFEDFIDYPRDPEAIDRLTDYMIEHRTTTKDLNMESFRVAVIGNLYQYEMFLRGRR